VNAREYYERLDRDAHGGANTGEPRLGRLVLDYVAERSSLTRATRYRYRTLLLSFAQSVDGAAPSELSRAHVEAWIASRKCAPSTLSHELSILRGWCQWLVLAGYCPREATLGVKVPRGRQQRVPLSPEEVGRVLGVPVDSRTRLVVSLTGREALRPLEISGLRLGDVERDGAALRVSGRHARTVPLTLGTCAALRAYLRLRPEGAEALIVSEPPSAPAAISSARVGELIHAALRASGVKAAARDSIDASGLRHAAMAGWKADGADPAGIGQAGGYRTLGEVDAQHKPWPVQNLCTIVAPAPTLPGHDEEAGE
jgi:site-specific recombinase XerC